MKSFSKLCHCALVAKEYLQATLPMSVLEKLQKANDRDGFANFIGYKPQSLAYVLYKIPHDRKYHVFEVEKRNGGTRIIKAPNEELKLIQKLLAKKLQECLDEIECEKFGAVNVPVRRRVSHGYVRGFSHYTNASLHKRKCQVFNVDIENFFPSINFGRVRGFFIRNKWFSLHKDVATVIAQIACHDNELPQGSPCSPIISNMVAGGLDGRLLSLARKYECTYTRYVDDLSFSTRKASLSPKIAHKDENGVWGAGKVLRKEVERSGFRLNSVKTFSRHRGERQVVTGLVVNRKINVPIEYYKKARAMAHSLFTSGEFVVGYDEDGASIPGEINQLRGILSYIHHIRGVEGKNSSLSMEELAVEEKKPKGINKLYRDFIFYEKFHALSRPLLICEGQTDSVHIKSALKHFSAHYPSLVKDNEGQVSYEISFHNHDSLSARITSTSGGAGNLKNFIAYYANNMQHCKHEARKHPVIVLLDHDKAAADVFSVMKEVLQLGKKQKVTGDKDFYHLLMNLYVVVLPRVNNKDTAIEDLYPNEVINREIDGNKFNFNNAGNGESNTKGKMRFAEYISSNCVDEDIFSNFRGVLERIASVLSDYADRLDKI